MPQQNKYGIKDAVAFALGAYFFIAGSVSTADIVSNPGHLCGPGSKENNSCGTNETKATQNVDGGEFPGEDETRVKKGAYLKDHPEGIVKNRDEKDFMVPEGSGSGTGAGNGTTTAPQETGASTQNSTK